MRVFLLGTLLLTTGCSGLSVRALVDDASYERQLRQSALTEAARQVQAGYHVAQVRIDNQSPLIMNRIRRIGDRAIFINGYRQFLHLHRDRLVMTQGYDTDVTWLGDLPGPLSVTQAGKPVCWQALWRAHGQRTAQYYPLQGCLRLGILEHPAFLQGRPAWRVTETVTSARHELRYDNDFWLDESRQRVIASRQQLGPLLPDLTWVALNDDSPDRINRASLYQAAPGQPVQVSVEGLVSQPLLMPPRLINLSAPYADRHDIDWQAVQLFDRSPDAVQHFLQERDALLADVRRLMADVTLTRSERVELQLLVREVESLRLARRVFALMEPYRLLAVSEDNLRLVGSHYGLVLRPYQAGVPVRGAVHAHQVFPAFGRYQRDLLPVNRWWGIAQTRHAVVILPDGRQLDADPSNPEDLLLRELPPGAVLFVPLRQSLAQRMGGAFNARLQALHVNSLP